MCSEKRMSVKSFFGNFNDLLNVKVGRGLMRNKDIGGDYIYTYMWQFQEPLRKPQNNHVSYASIRKDRSQHTQKKRQWWQGGRANIHKKY